MADQDERVAPQALLGQPGEEICRTQSLWSGHIDLLHEYRTRLTAGVVTGKLDVREAAAKLPSVDRLAADKYLDDILDADDGLECDHGEDVAELGE